jgi:hypothetical protein
MSLATALITIRGQLEYWQQERERARRNDDFERTARSEKFIAQCEVVIAALCEAVSNQSGTRYPPRADGSADAESRVAGEAQLQRPS